MKLLALTAALVTVTSACESDDGGAYARRITSADELIGGPGALGEVGDWLIGNNKIRVIIQDQGWSRGFGIFGGGIIDADLVRAGGFGTRAGGKGRDNFGEFFPAAFFQGFDVGDQYIATDDGVVEAPGIEVLADGSAGGPAIIRTRATSGDFLTLVSELLGAAIPKRGLRLETDYVIHPGTRHVEVVGRLINQDFESIAFPDPLLPTLLELVGVDGQIAVPLGDVSLFGAGNSVFAPGAVGRWKGGQQVQGAPAKPAGFDLRFSVEANYAIPRRLPALAGLVVDFLATAGPDVSYGFATADSDDNYVWKNREEYGKDPNAPISRHAMLVPYLIDAFAGAYTEQAPAELQPFGKEGSSFEYARYLMVGSGDVASIRDELYRIRGTKTAVVSGTVVNQRSGSPETKAQVHILDHDGHPYSQIDLDENGRFVCRLELGTYYYIVTAPGRYPFPKNSKVEATRFDTFVCANAGITNLDACADARARDRDLYIQIPPPAELVVTVRSADGRPLPAKVTMVAQYESEHDGQDPMDFLFDFWLGEYRRATDLTWRKPPEQRQRRYVEEVLIGHDGFVGGDVRPSCHDDVCRPYDIYVSRGPEYDIHVSRDITLHAGERKDLDVTLHRVVDTSHWVSTDLHVHSQNSVDSSFLFEERITQAAAEGLEFPVSTDHNYLTDYRPIIATLGLGDWMSTMVGVELSTLEMGHFNIYPLRYNIGSAHHFPFVGACNEGNDDKVNGTAFDWVECKPQQLFDNSRNLGRYGPQNTIVQVNHPRDSILGYFNQYYVNPYTAQPEVPDAYNYPATSFFIYPHDRKVGQFAPEAFSYDFDAIEVVNGKRFDRVHSFRLPVDIPAPQLAAQRDSCAGGHPDNGAGEVLLANGGHVAYPGVVDDWLNLLNAGKAFTAVGNSDSHQLDSEVGMPRTYLYVGPNADGTRRDQSLASITDLEIVGAIKSRRALVTNGPILDVAVLAEDAENPGETVQWGVGEVVNFAGDSRGREVVFLVTLRSAPWIPVDKIVFWANGKVVHTIAVPRSIGPDGRDVDDHNLFRWTTTFDQDVVVVAEATSSESMFPIYTPNESPPTDVTDALGGITAALDLGNAFGGTNDGITSPDPVQTVTPYALTNPIWLNLDGTPTWNPPGNDPGPGPAPAPGECTNQDSGRSVHTSVDRSLFYSPQRRSDLRDLLRDND